MKAAAIFACFMPWILLAVAGLMAPLIEAPVWMMMDKMALVWAMLSPVIIAGALLVAYREGQWSKKK